MTDTSITLLVVLLVVLLALSAFFSGSETALMTINRYRLRHMAEKGHRGARLAQRLLERPDRLIGLILICNNFVNVLASSIVTLLALRLYGEGAVAAAAGVVTLVVLIFGDVMPKTLGALYPERVAFPAAWVYTPLLKLSYPLVWATTVLANRLLALFGVRPDRIGSDTLSREELRTVVAESGALAPGEDRGMMLKLIDLADETVDDIMVPRSEMTGINLADSIGDIDEQLDTVAYSRLPVYEGSLDNIAGVLRIRRALLGLRGEALTLEGLRRYVEPPYFMPSGTSLMRALVNFRREKRRLAFVVDEYGDLLGLVTLADVLEEVIGEFTTDPADRLPDARPQEDGSFIVDGAASVRDLNRAWGWELPTDGPRTLNGLVLEQLEDIPEPGTSLKIAGYPVEIVHVKGMAVKTARIFPAVRTPGGGAPPP